MSRSILAVAMLLGVTLTALAVSQDEARKNDWTRSKLLVSRNGSLRGDKKTQTEVLAALDWLLRHQEEDGRWSSDKHPERCTEDSPCRNAEDCLFSSGAGFEGNDEGVTGLALLAFLARGNTHLEAEREDIQVAIDKGLRWLISRQDRDSIDPNARGRIVATTPKTGIVDRGRESPIQESWIYGHAIATIALAEALLGTDDRELLAEPVQAAADYLLRAQNPRYAWYYRFKDGRNGSSVTLWVGTALLLAEESADAGLISIERSRWDECRAGIDKWLDRAWSLNQGILGYQSPGDRGSVIAGVKDLTGGELPFDYRKTHANTAAGLFYTRLRDGKGHKLARKAWKVLQEDLPTWQPFDGTELCSIDFCYWYYGVHAARQKGGSAWKKWSKGVQQILKKQQRTDGCARGSWDPIGAWGRSGGRVYSTAIGALALEAEYRYAKR